MPSKNTGLNLRMTAIKKSKSTDSPDKILFSLFQKLDYRDKENSGKKKLIAVLIAYVFSNTVLSYNFYLTFDERSFIILTLTSNLFLISLIVLNDFDSLFLASRSYELLNSLPVKSSKIFFVKFLSAILFLFLFILAASLPQIIIFSLINHSLLKTLAYTLTNLMFCYFSVSLLIFVYIFILNYFTGKSGIILNLVQITFFVFIFYSSTLSSKFNTGSLQKASIAEYGAIKYFPQNFFSMSVYDPVYLLTCLVVTIVTVYCLPFFISKKYSSLLEKVKLLKSKKNVQQKKHFSFSGLNSFIHKYILTNNYERASYDLVMYQLSSSRLLKIKYLPMAVMPVLILLIGVFTDLPDLIFFKSSSSDSSFFKTAILVLSPSVTMTLLMSSRILISNTKILDENSQNTRWIFDTLPLGNAALMIKGSYKYIYINFLFPTMLLIFMILSLKAGITTALLNIFFISSGIYFINSVSMLFDKIYPFTLESNKFNSASKFIEIIFAMILGIILFLIQIFVFQNIIFVIVSVILFITVSILLNRN